MSIELHCPQCEKLIRAPDEAGGRHGKCPYCGRKVYIPMPEDQIEEIPLAPIDESEAEREERLRQEALDVAKSVLRDKSTIPVDAGDEPVGGSGVRRPEVPGEVVDLGEEVERFVLAMRDSKLDQAEQAVAALKRSGQRAKDYVQGLMVDEIPPEYENVPLPLLKGFLKTLYGRLG
jgi:hypothetical protein